MPFCWIRILNAYGKDLCVYGVGAIILAFFVACMEGTILPFVRTHIKTCVTTLAVLLTVALWYMVMDSQKRFHIQEYSLEGNDCYYVGPVTEDGQADGKGRLYDRHTEKLLYSGGFADSLRQGQGVMRYPDGDERQRRKYDGAWADDRRDGYGVLEWANGDRYKGDFKDDKRNGYGVLKWANGDRYEGEWREGEKYEGKFYFASNSALPEGPFRDGVYYWEGPFVDGGGACWEGPSVDG